MTHPYRTHLTYAIPLTVVAAVFCWMFVGSFTGQVFVLLLFAGLVGLPHGLTDFSVLSRVASHLTPVADSAKAKQFLVGVVLYLLVMLAFLLLWLVAPVPALLIFLTLSGHHFGTQDAKALGLTGLRYVMFACQRGTMVIVLPFVFHGETAQIFNVLVGQPFFHAPQPDLLVVMLVVLYIMPVGGLKNPPAFLEQLLLLGVYLTLPPLLSFTLYFCVWHTPRHYIEEWPVIQRYAGVIKPQPMLAALLAFALVGGGICGAGMFAKAHPEVAMQVFFITVACLTAAHVLFTEVAARMSGGESVGQNKL